MTALGLLAHNGQLHAVDVLGLGLSVLVAVAAAAWLLTGFLRARQQRR